jgi:hypothetical protein
MLSARARSGKGIQRTTMFGFESFAKLLILFGIVLAVLGGLLLVVGKIPFIGQLPGDFYIERENLTFYFPLTTSILISILFTLLFSLYGRR